MPALEVVEVVHTWWHVQKAFLEWLEHLGRAQDISKGVRYHHHEDTITLVIFSMRRHAAPMRLPWLQGRPSSSLSLQLQPRAGGFLGDDGDKTFEMSLDTFESKKHKQNVKFDGAMSSSMAVYNSNSSARTLTSTSMQGHHPTQMNLN